MSVGLILNLLNELNKTILCEPLGAEYYSFNEFNKFSNEPARIYILFILYTQKEL